MTGKTSLKTTHLKLLVVLALWCTSEVRAEVTDSDRDLVKKVSKRLLDALPLFDEYRRMEAYRTWPPVFEVVDQAVVNAFAEVGWNPRIIVCKGLLDKVVGQGPDREDRLATILGHELGHVVLMHAHPNQRKQSAALPGRAFDRQHELAADGFGLKLMLRAGFSWDGAREYFKTCIRLNDYTEAEALHYGHPSLRARAAALFKEEANYWRASGAFETGVFFMDREQYVAAEVCFQSVVKDFPECYEGWANLGHALLSQYCDLLRPEFLRKLGIGQIVSGGFYRRPESLIGPRGKDETWEEAVKALETARKLKPDLALVHANLGVAFLAPPKGKKIKEALAYLETAERLGQSLDRAERAMILNNLAVAHAAGGQAEKCDRALAELTRLLTDKARWPGRRPLWNALVYNRALSSADKTAAQADFETYLAGSSPAGLWWPLAYENYAALAKQVGKTPKARTAFQSESEARWRPVAGIKVDDLAIALTQPVEQIQQRFGKPSREVVAIRGTKLRHLYYDKYGFSALVDDHVLAISLHGASAPEVPLYEGGLGTTDPSRRLRVGMPLEKMEELLGWEQRSHRHFIGADSKYLFYYELGLAVKVDQGRAVEIVVAQIPRQGRGDL